METNAKFYYPSLGNAIRKAEQLKKSGFKGVKIKSEFIVTGIKK